MSRRTSFPTAALLLSFLSSCRIQCFSPRARSSVIRTQPTLHNTIDDPSLLYATPPNSNSNNNNNNNNNNSHDDLVGPEKSRMPGFIRNFLDKTKDTSSSSSSSSFSASSKSTLSTHLIAIPVDACHELQIELESVQRAILYHCPVLVHACLAPAVTRLPLLYVTAEDAGSAAGSAAAATMSASQVLHQIVNDVVQDFTTAVRVSEQKEEDGTRTDTAVTSSSDNSEETDGDVSSAMSNMMRASANAEGIEPWLVPFAGLNVTAGIHSPHEVLYTVADAQSRGTLQLQKFVQALRTAIEAETGWKTQLPTAAVNLSTTSDDDNDNNADDRDDADEAAFQPRIPFMRLPPNWKDILRNEFQQNKDQEEDSADDDDDDDFMLMLPSDQGGNGISPIFWAQWMGDTFGGEGETRMREVAVYRRRQDLPDAQTQENDERAFYLPELTVPLPRGNAALTKHEGKFEAYQEERMREAEEVLKEEKSRKEAGETLHPFEETAMDGTKGNSRDNDDNNDILLSKTKERLEALYSSPSNPSEKENVLDASPITEEFEGVSSTEGISDEQTSATVKSERGTTVKKDHGEDLDDWTKQRIEKAVASRARLKSQEELARKKNKPPIVDNPVFKQYKDGTLVPPEEQPKPVEKKELPPFPSRERCMGFWRVVRSPTGFDVEDGSDDSSRTDNLILRVDGTTAGGPILDQETRQKASGGTWRAIESNQGEVDGALRIRLVIPPKKQRILVMQGDLEKVSMSAADLPLASSTFGIPMLEERRARADMTSSDLEDIVYCNGNVWIEDAVTGKNREDIGQFSIMKLNIPTDPSQYTITVPKPVRNQD